jgi:hypothetical protein
MCTVIILLICLYWNLFSMSQIDAAALNSEEVSAASQLQPAILALSYALIDLVSLFLSYSSFLSYMYYILLIIQTFFCLFVCW